MYCGAQFSVAVSKSGTVFTWGKGDNHRLGHGSEEHVRYPKQVKGLIGKSEGYRQELYRDSFKSQCPCEGSGAIMIIICHFQASEFSFSLISKLKISIALLSVE